MNSWFSEPFSHHFVWLSLLSFLSLLGPYATAGRGRQWVMAVWLLVFAFGCICLAGAATGWLLGQPAYVVFPLAVAGTVITVVFVGFYRTLRHAYRDAELRRIAARDL